MARTVAGPATTHHEARAHARRAAPLAAVLALGAGATACNAVLGLGDFTDATSAATSSGATTGGAGGATTTTGGAGGSGGSTTTTGTGTGGAPHVWACAASPMHDVILEDEVGDGELDEKAVLAIAEPKSQKNGSIVHVVVHDRKGGRLLARTYAEGGSSPLVTFPVQDGHFEGIVRTPSGIAVHGTFQDGAGEVAFEVDPTSRRVTGTPTRTLAPVPAGDCTITGARFDSYAESTTDSPRHYAGSCSHLGHRTLFAGTWGGSVDVVDTGTDQDDKLVVSRIEPVGPLRMILLGSDGATWVRVGTKVDDLQKTIPVSLDDARHTLPYAMAPLPNDKGVALFLATVTPQSLLPATLFGGRILVNNVLALGKDASSLMTKLGEYTKLEEVNLWTQPSLDPTTMFAAGAAKTGSVRLYWLTRDLEVRVFGFEVDAPAQANTYYVNATAAHLGVADALVVYTRLSAAGRWSVVSRSVTCL